MEEQENQETNTPQQEAEPQSNNSKIVIAGVGAIIVIAGLIFAINQGKSTTPTDQTVSNSTEDSAGTTALNTSQSPLPTSQEPVLGIQDQNPDGSQVTSFNIEGGSFYFKPNLIKAKLGDTVKITFTNVEGTHDLIIDEFNAKTKRIQPGETDTIQFVVNKKGNFEFYCSVGNHRAQGMVGTLIVE